MVEARALNAASIPFKINAVATGLVTAKSGGIPQSIRAGSNVVITDVVKVPVEVSADKEFADIGDTIQYTVTLKNHSSVNLYGVKVINELCPRTAVVRNSISPVPQPGESLETGISVTDPEESSVGCLPKGKSAVLRYQVAVNEKGSGDIVNYAHAVIRFRDQTGSEYTGQTEPGRAVTKIAKANLQIVESADKTFVTEDREEVIFKIVVKNAGSVAVSDVVVTSPLPAGMTYQPNSTLKNGSKTFSDENPANGIGIGSLGPAEIYEIQFGVTVSL